MPDEKTGIATVGDLLANLGHNNPPPEPTPFELISKEITDLYEEAKGWLDGEPIANEGQAGEIAELRKSIRDVANRAEAQRKAEVKPFDEGKAEVQGRYNPLIQKDRGKTELALGALNKALAPYLDALNKTKREEAERAEKAAREAREAAIAASRAAAESANLAEREAAEEAQAHAKSLERTARAAEQSKAQVRATSGGRAIGMKTVYEPVLVDPAAALAHYRNLDYGAAALKECMLQLAKGDVRSNPLGAIPGFRIDSKVVPA